MKSVPSLRPQSQKSPCARAFDVRGPGELAAWGGRMGIPRDACVNTCTGHRRRRYENANRRGGGGEGDDDDALAPALVVAAMAVQPRWPACRVSRGVLSVARAQVASRELV